MENIKEDQMADISRITLIVLDSVGAGELPDADIFGE